MTSNRVVAAYRIAVRLYPKAFRDEYGDDLVVLLAEQLQDEAHGRVAARAAIDLALTIPQRHLETHMPATRSAVLPTVFGALALSSLVVGVVVGHPAVLLAAAAGALVFGALALLAAHRIRPLGEPRPLTSRWWMLMLSGAALLAGLIGVTTAMGELPSGGWFVAMALGLASLLLLFAGLILGILHLAGRERRSALAG